MGTKPVDEDRERRLRIKRKRERLAREQEQAKAEAALGKKVKTSSAAPLAKTKQKNAPPKTDPDKLDWASVMDEYAASSFGGGDYAQLQDGTNRVRFMMSPDAPSFFAVRRQVFIPFGGKSGTGQSIISPCTHDKAAYCPYTIVADELRKIAGGQSRRATEAKELERSIRPRAQYLSNVLVQEGKSWKQAVLQYPVTVWRGIVDNTKHLLDEDNLDPDGGVTADNPAHSKTGKIVIIERTGKKLLTDYKVTITPKVLPVNKEQLKARADLAPMCEATAEDELEATICTWFGTSSVDEILENIRSGAQLPSPKKPLGRVKKARRDDSEDDDSEDDEEDDAPPKKRRKPAPVIEDDSEDEEDDDDDLDGVFDDDEEEDDEDDLAALEDDDDEEEEDDDE